MLAELLYNIMEKRAQASTEPLQPWAAGARGDRAAFGAMLDISGTYKEGLSTAWVVEQTSDSFTVLPEDDSWELLEGRIKGSELEIWYLKGTFADDKITWEHLISKSKSEWIRTSGA